MKTKLTPQTDKPTLTIADLCEALADGRLIAHRDNEYYTVKTNDLRRWAQMSEITQLQPTPGVLDRFMAAS
jgi:hypothetical protein